MRYRLVSTGGELAFELMSGVTLVVGRAPTCDIPIFDPTVSRRHAEMFCDDAGVSVTDLHSHNGTLLNGSRIESAKVALGDIIAFGKVAFRLEESVPSRTPAVPTEPAGAMIDREIRLVDARMDVAAGHLALLLKASQGLARQGATDLVLEETVNQCFQVFGVDRVSILLADETNALVPRISRDRRGGSIGSASVPRSIARKAAEARAIIVSDNADDDIRLGGQSILLQQIRSKMCVPLIGSDNRVLGVLYVDSPLVTHRFDDDDVSFMSAFSGIVAAAVESSQFSQLLGAVAKEGRGPESEPTVAQPADAEPVDAAVFCPPRVATASVFIVQVFLYPPAAADAVEKQAMSADATAEPRGTYSLPLELRHGTRIDIRLEMAPLCVVESDALIIWRGAPSAVQFEVTVPAEPSAPNAIGRVRFAIDGVPAGTLRFQVTLVSDSPSEHPELREAQTTKYRRAFVSYSSKDRAEVLRRVQAFKIAGISVFQDILDLEPGERWETELHRQIDSSDVFLLFWSHAAAISDEVAKEIDYALVRKAGNDDNPPDIQPVPIEGPPIAPPPEKLKHLHFNDALLAQIRAG